MLTIVRPRHVRSCYAMDSAVNGSVVLSVKTAPCLADHSQLTPSQKHNPLCGCDVLAGSSGNDGHVAVVAWQVAKANCGFCEPCCHIVSVCLCPGRMILPWVGISSYTGKGMAGRGSSFRELWSTQRPLTPLRCLSNK